MAVVTHVVIDQCAGCRFTLCVTGCPVSCFHGDDERLYIDPDLCIDCGACIPLCPVKAILEDIDLADDGRRWLAINAERASALPVIGERQPALEGAEARRAALGFGS